jgi:hypothetical protein
MANDGAQISRDLFGLVRGAGVGNDDFTRHSLYRAQGARQRRFFVARNQADAEKWLHGNYRRRSNLATTQQQGIRQSQPEPRHNQNPAVMRLVPF